MNLKQQSISGIKWTSLSSAFIGIISIVQLSILTHYLSPSDYGLMAIVMVVIGFSRLFLDMGISNSIIHNQNISQEQLSSLYWLNIFSGILLFFIVSGVSFLISSFYKEPELVKLVIILSTTFIIFSFGNQYKVLLQKELQFNLLAKIEIVALVTSFIVAVLSAINGYGVYALVFANLTVAIISSGLYLYYGMKNHHILLIYKYQEIKKFINFGLFQMGENTLNYFYSQFDVILIGRLFGIESLGIYSVAKTLAMKPAQIINPIITRVTFPIMAKLQDDPLKLKYIYLKTISSLSTVNFPIYIAIIILAEPIVALLFGNEWIESIVILRLLSIYGAIRSIGNPIGSLQLAKGRADLGFYWHLALFLFLPLCVYIGSNWDLVGISFSLIILMTASLPFMWYFMVKPLCGAKFKEYFSQILKPMILAVSSGIVASSMMLLVSNNILQIILVSLVGLMTYGMLLKIFHLNFIETLKVFRK